MRRLKLGNTPLEVSRLCFGTGLLGHLQARLTPEQAGPILKRAFELGVTFWDTADGYKTHPHVREGLRGLDRRQIVLATKTTTKTAEEATSTIARFLEELDTDYLDLVHLHGVDSPEEFEARRGALQALLEAKARGLIRAVGLSTHDVSTARILPEVADDGIEASLVVLNRTGHNLAGGTVPEMEAATRKAFDRGLGIYTMKVFGQRKALAEHTPEELLSHNLALPYVHALVVGMISIAEVEQNVEIVERRDVPEAR
jgi:aryl-alcohol dehydrogenase-like predicted oxidoreductase